MKATLVSIAAAIAVVIGARVWAQDIVASPGPVATAATVQPVAKVVVRTDPWRYRWYGGRWWYWTPENRWMWYGDGGWTTYVPAPAPAVVYSPGYVYPYGYYPYGYYGPRVAVGVWGPRGYVRAGRWGVWW
jgi:hypothetical protein